MSRLFIRIFLWFWLGSTCLLLVLAAGALIVQPDFLSSWRLVGRSTMRYLGFQAANAYEQEGQRGVDSLFANVRREARFRVWLYTAEGQPAGEPAPVADAHELVTRALADDDTERAVGGGRLLLARRVTSSSGRSYVLIWEAPFRLRAPFLVSPLRFSLRLAALILTSGALCWWLTWQITRPIRTLRTAARQFAQGVLDVRISGRQEFRRGDELSELAREFDHMAVRIQELVKAQQQLLADISHELRSPLARLSLALDLARRRLGDGIPEHQRIEREVQRLNDLIQQLLTLAQLQRQSGQARFEPVNLRNLVHEVADDARFEAELMGRKVVVASDLESSIGGNRALLRSGLENVVRNAVRHTPEGTEVTIDMVRPNGAGRLVIAVRDRGPGVPAHALDRLFDPFFRVDEGRDRASGGVGLGLAITRQAMLAHGGNASAQNHRDGGLLVRLELPAD